MTDQEFINLCETSKSMVEAAKTAKMTFYEFKIKAIRLNCYDTNKGHRHSTIIDSYDKLQEILNGKHPTYQAFKLKKLLFKHQLKENKCEVCGISEWNRKTY